jgi:hypothetical protein
MRTFLARGTTGGNVTSLTDLFASKLIARTDVKAIQHRDGSYEPDRTPWRRSDLEAHIAGTRTFGHYVIAPDDTCKIFCLDVDLRANRKIGDQEVTDGWLPISGLGEGEVYEDFLPASPRQVWSNRADPRRGYLKYSMRLAAAMFAERIWTELKIPVAVAYSGSKGIHVYGLVGKGTPASDAREGAMIVMDSMGIWTPYRGDSVFELKDRTADNELSNFTVEVYPKQSSLQGKDLGNLLRLPLGRNCKSTDPTFFMDLTSALVDMRPVDPEWALTTTNPWLRPGE